MLFLALALLTADPAATAPTTPAAPATTPTTPTANSTPATPTREERLKSAVATLKKTVKAGLEAELAKAGPVGAIRACGAVAASAVADAKQQGVTLGRTSTKLRNPQNAPQPWVAPLLAAAEQASARGESFSPQVVNLQNGRIGYVEAITVQPLCLTCHGTAIAEPVQAALKASYPNDQATGYVDGAFRGLFWAELGAPALKLPASPTKP